MEIKSNRGYIYQRFDKTLVRGRWKPTATPTVYQGQALIKSGLNESWTDETCTIIEPTVLEIKFVGGGNSGREHLVGPAKVLERRSQAGYAWSGVPLASGGSGFLVSRSLVVTNYHVIRDAKAIKCFVNDTAFDALWGAQDEQSDLALLRLSPEPPLDVPILQLGDSARVVQGEQVYAMGYPLTEVLGKGLHVHNGIVSSVVGFGGRASEFQVEMSLNPGNSGGPLLDASGQVIGIVASKLSLGYAIKTGTIPEGVTFAIKADLLRSLISTAGAGEQIGFATTKPTPIKLEDMIPTLGKAVVRIETQR